MADSSMLGKLFDNLEIPDEFPLHHSGDTSIALAKADLGIELMLAHPQICGPEEIVTLVKGLDADVAELINIHAKLHTWLEDRGFDYWVKPDSGDMHDLTYKYNLSEAVVRILKDLSRRIYQPESIDHLVFHSIKDFNNYVEEIRQNSDVVSSVTGLMTVYSSVHNAKARLKYQTDSDPYCQQATCNEFSWYINRVIEIIGNKINNYNFDPGLVGLVIEAGRMLYLEYYSGAPDKDSIKKQLMQICKCMVENDIQRTTHHVIGLFKNTVIYALEDSANIGYDLQDKYFTEVIRPFMLDEQIEFIITKLKTIRSKENFHERKSSFLAASKYIGAYAEALNSSNDQSALVKDYIKSSTQRIDKIQYSLSHKIAELRNKI
jgi:hypothetical protein